MWLSVKKGGSYFWKGSNFVAALSREGDTVTADFRPNFGELQGELGALLNPLEPSVAKLS